MLKARSRSPTARCRLARHSHFSCASRDRIAPLHLHSFGILPVAATAANHHQPSPTTTSNRDTQTQTAHEGQTRRARRHGHVYVLASPHPVIVVNTSRQYFYTLACHRSSLLLVPISAVRLCASSRLTPPAYRPVRQQPPAATRKRSNWRKSRKAAMMSC